MNRRDLFKFLFGVGLGVAAAETYERLYNIPALERAFRKEIEYWLSQYLDAKRKAEELSSKLKTKEEEINALQKDVSYWKSQYDVAQDEVNKLNTKVGELSSKLDEANEKIDSLEKELDNWKSKYESTKEEANRLKSIIGSMDELERESVDAISYYREKMNEAINSLKRTIEKYRAILGDDRVAFESSTVKILEDLKLTQEKLKKVLPYFPLILNFGWKPTKVINDKIYDINVSFEVISPLNSLREVEVMLIPEEYRYFITKYGMRKEDYDKVFPKEETRSVKIKPLNLERVMFSVDFEDLEGGREYIVNARVEDVAGNKKMVEVKTPYIRQFENLGKELYEKGIIVGSSYYGWYKIDKDSWGNYKYKGESLLGEYSSLDRIVVDKQIDYMTGHGINLIYISWPPVWGKGKIDMSIKNILNSDLGKEVYFSILYEHGNNLNLDDEATMNEISENLKYLFTLIPRENLLKINNKPLVYFYDLPAYKGDIFNLKRSVGSEVFIIGDYAKFNHSEDILKTIQNLDGVTVWAGHYDSSGYYDGLYSQEKLYEKKIFEWSNWIKEKIEEGRLPQTFVYIPSVIPEFDSRFADWGDPNQVPLPRDAERFYKQLQLALSSSIPKLFIRIDTWNDWYESTIIEPSTRWEFTYLQIIKETLEKSRYKY